GGGHGGTHAIRAPVKTMSSEGTALSSKGTALLGASLHGDVTMQAARRPSLRHPEVRASASLEGCTAEVCCNSIDVRWPRLRARPSQDDGSRLSPRSTPRHAAPRARPCLALDRHRLKPRSDEKRQ